ncbi:haloacid dehalogenase type II [Alsobacter sp. SYSU M60028]|uniref:(S)-2-haloacid dehalogenase n=1 Tax=Alsobacter ponti TaxID=2962936 RepID=A0ABT1LCH5_9HYPH|nr:haloacid dehalogenase type II [Alsobacter ponti]MCP8938786.1 haloacid dehalogenase type II [Alsobacter ponti]
MPQVRICLFDAYGTLFDVHSAVARHAGELGDAHEGVARLWRQRQLEYTWVRSLMGRHADFWTVTGEALDFALASHGLADPALRDRLMKSYSTLTPYPEVRAVLADLRERGLRNAILTNGSPAMIEAALASAGLTALVDDVITVEEVGVYKTDPRVYRHAIEALGVEPDAISFQSSNAWDAAAASDHRFRVVWVNRSGQPPEYRWVTTGVELPDLSGLPDHVAPRG